METPHRQTVRSTLKEYIKHLDIEHHVKRHGTPLLIFDPQKLKDQYLQLQNALPDVKFYFALKAAGHAAAVRAIKTCNGYLDVATMGEIELVRSEGFPMNRCMHTHPIKKPDEIMAAYNAGIRRFVIENKGELKKFATLPKDIELLIRLSYLNPEAGSNLSYKFGASIREAEKLVRLACAQDTTVAGFCLHVGSQIHSADAYVTAISTTAHMMNELEQKLDITFTILDIGGGFPVDYQESTPSLHEIAAKIRPLISPLMKRYTILAEPGRFVAAPSATLVTSVVGVNKRYGKPWYYIDDGMYGAYSIQIYDHMRPHLFALKELLMDAPGTQLQPSVIAGPTCDSIDIVAESYPLPKLTEGDMLISPMMGAYTIASATSFNGIPVTKILTLSEDDYCENTGSARLRDSLALQSG